MAPLRVYHLLNEGDAALPAIAVSVPKRLFRKAVDRNLLKRRIKEAYRKNKAILLEDNGLSADGQLHLVIQYKNREILPYSKIEESLVKALRALRK